MISFACIDPHAPIFLPNVGSPADREKVKKTISSLEKLAPKLAETDPEIIIISSPHPDWGIKVPLHFLNLKLKIPHFAEASRGRQNEKLQFKIKNYQDAGNVVVDPVSKGDIYPVLTTFDSPRKHFEWGEEVGKLLPPERRVAWIASGDMSHRLKEDGPYGLHPSGPKYDHEFIRLFKEKDVEGILNLDPNLIEEAGECGLRSFCLLLGALKATGVNWQPEIFSYEGPFGVGYLVANIKILGQNLRVSR